MKIHAINRRNVLQLGTGMALGLTLAPYKANAAEETKLNIYGWDNYFGPDALKKAEPSRYLGEDATLVREDLWTAVQAA